MSPKVYIETSVISYLTARPSRDLIVAAHQQITQAWWESQSNQFELYTSQLVLGEAGSGDPEAVARRLTTLSKIEVLDIQDEAADLADDLIARGALPAKAADDALHIAVAVIHRMDYLLTWNCKHIANATMRPTIEQTCRAWAYRPPVICTPEELRR